MEQKLGVPENNMRERVDKLRETDNSRENSIERLAHKEKEFREELPKDGKTISRINEILKKLGIKNKIGRGVSQEDANRLGNKFSTETLEKIEAQKEGLIDELTGLKNRKALNIEGAKILSFEKRTGGDCGILMFDADDFKSVNDKFGHQVGDKFLKKLAEITQEVIRKEDIPYRYGGEEVVIILPGANTEKALKVAEKIREKIENTDMKIFDENGKDLGIKRTVSIGALGTDKIDNWKDEKSNNTKNVLEKILLMVDHAMYFSKCSGKNRVTEASEEISIQVEKKKEEIAEKLKRKE